MPGRHRSSTSLAGPLAQFRQPSEYVAQSFDVAQHPPQPPRLTPHDCVQQQPAKALAATAATTNNIRDLMGSSLYQDWAGPEPLPSMEPQTGSKTASIERGQTREMRGCNRDNRPLACSSAI
jgi:hypothetical protein